MAGSFLLQIHITTLDIHTGFLTNGTGSTVRRVLLDFMGFLHQGEWRAMPAISIGYGICYTYYTYTYIIYVKIYKNDAPKWCIEKRYKSSTYVFASPLMTAYGADL